MEKLKIGSIIASAAFLGSAFLFPASADFDFEISHNGKDSDNEIDFDFDNRLSINQVNNTDINNDVDLDLNTGNNHVSGNTGGDVSVETGDIDANVEISNMAGFNYAKVDSCHDCQGDFEFEISGNGKDSDNEIDFDFDNDTSINQVNNTDVDNDVKIDANTGDNHVSGNTGSYHPVYFDKHDYDKDYDHDKDYDKTKFVKYYPHDESNDYNHDSKYHDWSDHEWYYDAHENKFLSKNYNWCKEHEFDYDWWKKYNHDWDKDWYHDGGDVSVETGDIDANVEISNVGGFNYASVH